LVEKDRRKLKSYELEEVLRREFAGITDAKVTVVSLRGGPTAGSAFQAEISGPDLDELKKSPTTCDPRFNQFRKSSMFQLRSKNRCRNTLSILTTPNWRKTI